MFKKSCYWLVGFFIFNLSATLLANNHKTLDHLYEKQAFYKVGETTFSLLFWDLYNSKLLTSTGKYPIDLETEQLVYQINYLADISKSDLIKRTIEQWQYMDIPRSRYQHYLTDLDTIWPNIESGDSLSLVILAGASLFYYNGVFIGEITDQKFGPLFLDIWLSEKTSEPKLRLALLGIKP